MRVNEYAMREGNPNMPWTAAEIGRDARAIRDAGAAVIHFYARKDDGGAFLSHLPKDRRNEWTVCCKHDLFPIAMRAIAEGGHVSIGISELGRPTDADLVMREIVRMARLVGCEIATPAEASAMVAL